MTSTQLAVEIPGPAATSWDAEFANLKTRYPRAKPSIVFCVHALQQNPSITIDDLRPQAALHGIRVTAASLTAAHRLMAPAPASAPTPADTAPTAGPAAAARPRRVRMASPATDAETLIRQMVGKLQSQSSAETERLRDAVRKAVDVLQAALG